MTLQRRLMLTFAAFTLAVAALFALFAMAFTYTVEDRFIEQRLQREATRLNAHHALHGRWPALADMPRQMRVHEHAGTLPDEVAAVLAAEPRRREIAGAQGRHYHLLPLVREGQPPWLLAEVSEQLIVRPMRADLLRWLAGWGLGVVGLAGLLGWLLARRVSRPLARLSAQMQAAQPQALPRLPGAAGTAQRDEIGAMTHSLDALLDRTREFIEREQAFSRDASHELRTPLAVLRIGLDRLHGQADAPLRRELLPLQTAVRLMEQTVATLLMLAREPAAEPGGPGAAILPLVEDWVLAHAGALDAKAMRIDCRLGHADALALPSPVLQLVLSSLLANALAHGQAGGCIEIGWRGASLYLRNPGGGDARSTAGAGSGLGLAIVQRLLAQHGATLAFEQAGGQTEVRIELAPAMAPG